MRATREEKQRPHPGTHRDERGFGLLEVLASVILFALAAAALSASTVGSIKANHTSRHSTAASALIYDKIDQLRALNQGAADLAPGTHTDALNPITPLGAPGGMYTRSWTITRDVPRPGLSEVVVSVTWNNPEPREITAITYVCWRNDCFI